MCLLAQVMKPQEAELVTEISKVPSRASLALLKRQFTLNCDTCQNLLNALCSVTMHGVGAEDRFYQRSPGARSDPTRRHVPEGGAGGE